MSPITSRITPSVQRMGMPTMNPMMRRMIPRVIMRYLANGRLIQNQLWHIYASICWMVSPSHALRRPARVQTGCQAPRSGGVEDMRRASVSIAHDPAAGITVGVGTHGEAHGAAAFANDLGRPPGHLEIPTTPAGYGRLLHLAT